MNIIKIKKFYRNYKWIEFSDYVKKRDNYKCQSCMRSQGEVVLQVHHEIYKKGKLIWEYALSDCITLCKGCHAREHGLIEPTSGWTLLSIDDLGELNGICERKNCNTSIRYEHIAYHPQWGYKAVGSECIKFLTEEDKLKSRQYLKLYKKISKILNTSTWDKDKTKKNNKPFIYIKYQKSIIRIYENHNKYSYQIAFYLGKNKYKWLNIYNKLKNINNIEIIKELALINLMGVIAYERNKIEEYKELQEIYRNIRKSTISQKKLG